MGIPIHIIFFISTYDELKFQRLVKTEDSPMRCNKMIVAVAIIDWRYQSISVYYFTNFATKSFQMIIIAAIL